MKNALIVSLNYRVAHVSHLVASYKQQEELGYKSYLYIHPGIIPFLPQGIRYITNLKQIENVNLAIFWFPAAKNLKEMLRLKLKYSAKLIYVFHEPIESFQTYRKFGLSFTEIIKTYARYLYTLSFLLISDAVILPSNKALGLYESSISRYVNTNYKMIPLLFDDERSNNKIERLYFSYIGTIAHDHAYDEFVDFILKSAKDGLSNIKFLIATRNIVSRNPELESLIKKEILVVHDGKPLSNEEINRYYSQSICVWNAYHRTTQSGVLAKAAMFGTPAIVISANLSEFSIDGYNVKAINSNRSYDEISNALDEIKRDLQNYINNSRKLFESHFYYKKHNNSIAELLRQIKR